MSIHECDILQMAKSNNITGVQHIIQVGPISINNTDEEKLTAAHLAAKNGSIEIVQYLIEKDSSLLTAKDIHGKSILDIAVECSKLPLIKYLIEHKNMDMYEQNALNFGNTVFHIAAQEGHLRVLDYLVKTMRGDIHVRNQLGQPAYFAAAERQKINVIKHMTENLDANMTLTDFNDDNILFISAKLGDLALFKYLVNIRQLYFNLNWRNRLGATITYTAAKHDNYDFLKYITGQKLPDLNIVNNEGKGPLHEAATNGNYHMVRYLCRHGANSTLKDIHGKKPIDYASSDLARIYLENVSKRRYPPQPRVARDVSYKPNYNSREKLSTSSSNKSIHGKVSRASSIFSLDMFSHMENFLNLAIICFRYQKMIHDSLFSFESIMRSRFDPFAMDAINAAFNFEH